MVVFLLLPEKSQQHSQGLTRLTLEAFKSFLERWQILVSEDDDCLNHPQIISYKVNHIFTIFVSSV